MKKGVGDESGDKKVKKGRKLSKVSMMKVVLKITSKLKAAGPINAKQSEIKSAMKVATKS